ncbi:3059_t:CDS:1, partial [Dentiscutata heterogama]
MYRKSENINAIDNFVANQSTKIDKKKWCHEYGKDNIKNSKCKCPQCNMKLLTLAEIQQEIDQSISKKKDTTKPLVFKTYNSETNVFKNSTNLINPLSITQTFESQKNTNTPDILVPDPLPINPNSIVNIQKVLDYIKKISRINK